MHDERSAFSGQKKNTILLPRRHINIECITRMCHAKMYFVAHLYDKGEAKQENTQKYTQSLGFWPNAAFCTPPEKPQPKRLP